ncbi:hypothetical protein F6X37_24655 [Paraburkholderia sp. 31.1]|nr:hypothetical protein [Paraburkholderia sp. 31.1]
MVTAYRADLASSCGYSCLLNVEPDRCRDGEERRSRFAPYARRSAAFRGNARDLDLLVKEIVRHGQRILQGWQNPKEPA